MTPLPVSGDQGKVGDHAGPARPGAGPGAITPDGCAVEVYRRLPPAGEAELVHAAVPAGTAVLDLGCGVGRIAGPLTALGHPVVGVDESAAMLALLPAGVEPVGSRIDDLYLPTRFGAVLLASHLVNTPDAAARAALLDAAARHLAAHGVLVAQWNPPAWFARLRTGGRYSGALGDVGTELEVLALTPDVVQAVVRYSVDGLRWEQWFRAARLDVDALDAELAAAGLRRSGWLTADETWFAAVLG
jgi:SAM-dependent methyltransferase